MAGFIQRLNIPTWNTRPKSRLLPALLLAALSTAAAFGPKGNGTCPTTVFDGKCFHCKSKG